MGSLQPSVTVPVRQCSSSQLPQAVLLMLQAQPFPITHGYPCRRPRHALAPSLSLTHTRTRMHTHSDTHSLARSISLSLSLSLSLFLSFSLKKQVPCHSSLSSSVLSPFILYSPQRQYTCIWLLPLLRAGPNQPKLIYKARNPSAFARMICTSEAHTVPCEQKPLT
jgi:hypothetical protein